jgi:dihydroorotate dehydrogenase (fumarate)
MIDLTTHYLGLALKNPLVPSASPLTRSLDSARRLEDAGAAALVMHSLFEEAVSAEEGMLDRFLVHQDTGHAEAPGFLPVHPDYQSDLDAYLEQLVTLRNTLDIPIIASLNGTTPGGWLDLGKEIEQAGADALELNVYYLAGSPEVSAAGVEARYIALLEALKRTVTLPIVMKLSPWFSSLPHFVRQLEAAGADGIALFNRFYQPDLDLDTLNVIEQPQLSSPADALPVMRWIAILYGRSRLGIAATGGVYSAREALKMLLAGADVVHLASALLRHGPELLTQVLTEMGEWMEAHEYHSVTELKGSLSQRHQPDPGIYARASYVRVLDSHTPGKGVWR